MNHGLEWESDCDYCKHSSWVEKHASWFDINRKQERHEGFWSSRRLFSLMSRYPVAELPLFNDAYWDWLDNNKF